MQSSHIPWKLKRHACTDFGSRRGEAMERKEWFRNYYCQNQGACVIAIIWLGQKVGREQDGLKG
jgi:hypothetical protein